MNIEQALADLADDPSFQLIHRRMGRFNIFEAVGAVRGELRHSNFLGFLLSPSRSHGLGSEPLLRFIRMAISSLPASERPVRSLELMVGDLDSAIIHREWNGVVDILIEVTSLNLVVLIENKVDSDAYEGQLATYKRLVEDGFPNRRRVFVFLTPEGRNPGHAGYVAISYAGVARIIDSLLSDHEPTSDVASVLRHYIEMLRRHIVPDQELESLARALYERHREAFDYVFKLRPNRSSLLQIAVTSFESTPGLTLDRLTSAALNFAPESWSSHPNLNNCSRTAWTRTGRSVTFEIKTYNAENYRYRVNLALIIGPGPAIVRRAIYDMAAERADLFKNLTKSMGVQYVTIFSKDLLSHAAGASMRDDDERAAALQAAWSSFVTDDLPVLTDAIRDFAEAVPSFPEASGGAT